MEKWTSELPLKQGQMNAMKVISWRKRREQKTIQLSLKTHFFEACY